MSILSPLASQFFTKLDRNCTEAQLCKDGPQKEGDQLSTMSGRTVEIHSLFSSLHLDKKKKKKSFGMAFWLKAAQSLKCDKPTWKVIDD